VVINETRDIGECQINVPIHGKTATAPKKASTKMPETNNQKNEVALFISQAIEKGLPVETMDKLFALREKVKAEQAREAYVEASKASPTVGGRKHARTHQDNCQSHPPLRTL
jgi:hypothetical protein